MNKDVAPLYLTYKDKEYVLDFDKASIMWAEERDIDFVNVINKPMTTVIGIFLAAFRKNHPEVDKNFVEEMLDDLGGVNNIPENVIERLGKLWHQQFERMQSKEAKNLWTAAAKL